MTDERDKSGGQPETAGDVLSLSGPEEGAAPAAVHGGALKAAVEAIVYVADEPVTVEQIAAAVEAPRGDVVQALAALRNEYCRNDRGIEIREVAGGFKMFTKPEHHDLLRRFVKSLTPPLKLSMAALETLATIAYRQPITVPEIQAIRGVQGAGVLKTLLDRKLITTAGRKNVIGRPILYKTTREFLVQFGLASLQDLPSMAEFEELLRSSFADPTPPSETAASAANVLDEGPVQAPAEAAPETIAAGEVEPSCEPDAS